MRTIETVMDSIAKFGFAHLRKESSPLEEVEKMCRKFGLSKEETLFHYILRLEGNHGSKTDWDRISKDRAEKRLKAAVAKKKKEQK